APLAESRGLRLECTLHEPASAWMDRSQIERVLSNLIGNAVKFTPRGGAVTVTASLSGEEVCFAVADTGPGIPQSDLPHVFSRYWQATRGDRRGVGLGLAIAQGIVTAHGGRIWVDSEPERGAVFYFTVPVTPGTYGPGARQTS
ncbi:MAG TPA: HAMP domain-containing sensor histidine kinase, partial [Longimicrobiales bacterium]|nr:HAMP domain-containing sensor histidine kinase [Longimicrobiales bacterium]